MPTTKITVDAVLFDMDGTLIDSTAGVVGAWHVFSETYPHINVTEILSSAHGIRTVDNLRNYCGITDPVELEKEAVRFEQEIVNSSRKNGVEGIVLLPGVRAIIDSLRLGSEPPACLWAVCTSATKSYATQALDIAGVPVPPVFVGAEDVERGKPNPDPYLLGAKLCNVDPKRCLVVEDAPAGVSSGRAAGCKVISVVTTHSPDALREAKPDFLVTNLSSVSMNLTTDGIEVTIIES